MNGYKHPVKHSSSCVAPVKRDSCYNARGVKAMLSETIERHYLAGALGRVGLQLLAK